MNSNTIILRVAVASALGRLLDYFPPEHADISSLQPGMRLTVPLRKKNVTGIVMEVDQNPQVEKNKIRNAVAIIDHEPLLTPTVLALYQWAGQYYHYPLNELLFGTIPKLIREGKTTASFCPLIYRMTSHGALALAEGLKRAPKQRALLHFLQQHPQGILATTIHEQGFSSSEIKKLLQRSWIEALESSTMAQEQNVKHQHPDYQLNEHQQCAIREVLSASAFKTFLLEGVTGSGKTEVYLQCIAEKIKNNQQILLLVPEIALTPQTVKRFEERFHIPIVTLHSGLSDGARAKGWSQAAMGQASIIIGTRSAIFTPLKNPGMIIVDEEHDASFKQQSGFRYHARDLAVMRGQLEKIPVLLGSATPSLESWHNNQRGRYQLLELPQRAGSAKLPNIQLIDIQKEKLSCGLSKLLLKTIHEHLAQNAQVLLFLNRRGYAPTLICQHCGFMVLCQYCDARMTVHLQHQQPYRLFCHHCGFNKNTSKVCESCQQSDLAPVGIGTEKLQQFLKQEFPQHSMMRFDRDSVRSRQGLHDMIKRIHEEKISILLGTQMLAKGHHLPRLSLVAVVDADGGLFSADFRATERMGQLLMQVAGRAGRESLAGTVLIQTRFPQHPLLQLVLANQYRPFAEKILEERMHSHLPPYSSLALLIAEANTAEKPLQYLTQIRQQFQKKIAPGIKFLGPVAAVMERKAGKYRAQLLIQASHRGLLQKQLQMLKTELADSPKKSRMKLFIDVDPQEMI